MKESNDLRNQLRTIRTRLGLSQQDIASAAGIARQTVGGIESELYAPSASVAMKLAKALGCRVEDIFWLEGDSVVSDVVPAEGTPVGVPMRLTLAQICGRWVAHPLHGEGAFRNELVPADGFGTWLPGADSLDVTLLDDQEALARTVIIAGCTPALSLWARSTERWFPGLRVHWMHANSMAALDRLARGEVHAAGLHLCDPATGEYNIPFVRQALSGRPAAIVNLGVWKEGFVVQPGNPKGIQSAADLANIGVKLINREKGAGSRLLLDTLLSEQGVSSNFVDGYENAAQSHHALARAIVAGQADVGVSTEATAQTFGLDFVSQRLVRYDLALLEEVMRQEPVRQLLSTLQHRWVRSQLELLGGYDTATTGEMIVV